MSNGPASTAYPPSPWDADSFEAYVAARGDALWRTAWLLTVDRHLAEDLVQSALVKAWPKWQRVGTGGFEPYVRRILVTTYIAWWRRRWNGEGTVALRVDLIALQEIFRLTVAPSGQTAALSD